MGNNITDRLKYNTKQKESEPNEWVSGEYPGDTVQID